MKLSISNIAWEEKDDELMYHFLKEKCFDGIEIAPTRIWSEKPYEQVEQAKSYTKSLQAEYGLRISSMQSIWYGRTENIFESNTSRERLLEYTKQAIIFAEQIGCKNLVFGCPKNRNKKDGEPESTVYDFFKTLGEYAYQHNTVVALEANPTIYNTNFINTTQEAIDFVKVIDSKGLLINYDLGTSIYNGEEVDLIAKNMHLMNHIHISEPYLEKIKKRELHKELAKVLRETNYQNFVSIEMKKQDNMQDILSYVEYLAEVFK